MKVAVVGGSLGGLTTACLLRDAGHDVVVYERSPRELEQRGAGIGLLSATSRYLVERAGSSLDDVSIATSNIRYLNRRGDVVHDGEQAYRFSSWNTIYRVLMAAFPADRYLLDHELCSFEQDEADVTLTFTNGASAEAELLVCADGVGSVGREQLQPAASASYAGYVAWRGMVPEAELAPELIAELEDAITYHVYANSHILVYPIPGLTGSVTPGERLINFVWYRNYMQGGDLDDLLTDRTGTQRALSVPPGWMAAHHEAEARATASARLPPQIAAVVEGCPELFVQVVHDIEVERVAFGRVCLVGDSAFSARPHAAAGTAKAADDAWSLVDELGRTDGVVEALEAWEPGRLDLGAALVARTREIGRRSQVDSSWLPGDPAFVFGLHHAGEP